MRPNILSIVWNSKGGLETLYSCTCLESAILLTQTALNPPLETFSLRPYISSRISDISFFFKFHNSSKSLVSFNFIASNCDFPFTILKFILTYLDSLVFSTVIRVFFNSEWISFSWFNSSVI
eukprot:NODE_610_length_6054_cov_0.409908.p4 type:complete len:122 gc:universal NODE_610_length_6054_cov_0.409908:3631-3996(+)